MVPREGSRASTGMSHAARSSWQKVQQQNCAQGCPLHWNGLANLPLPHFFPQQCWAEHTSAMT